ncbi:MAG TPA: hypothetical protein VLM05_07200 [Mycobacteriales bacterium]|nr:hypothetical protein [Mycobacteriales bacterium]
MFLSNWRLLFRRWYVVILGLLATGVLCFLAVQVVPVKYQATSAVVLLPPETATTQQGGNPYLALGGLDTVSGVVAKAMADRNVQLGIRDAGGTGSYTLVPDLAAGGPVLLITVEDTTPGGALATLDVIAKQLPRTLASLQTSTGVRESSLIRSKPITRDDVAQPVRKSQIRALFAAAAAGLAGTVLAASVLDGFLGRRSDERKRRRDRALRLAGGDPDPEPTVEPTAVAPRELTAEERDRLANRLASGGRAPGAPGRTGRDVPTPGRPDREIPAAGRPDREVSAAGRPDWEVSARDMARLDRDIPSRDGRGREVPGRDVPVRPDRERPARVHNLTPLNGSVRSVPNGLSGSGRTGAANGSVNGSANGSVNGSSNGSANGGIGGSGRNGAVAHGVNGGRLNGSANGATRNGAHSSLDEPTEVARAPRFTDPSIDEPTEIARAPRLVDPSIDEPTEVARVRPAPAVDQDTVDFRRLAAELREARADGRFSEPE